MAAKGSLDHPEEEGRDGGFCHGQQSFFRSSSLEKEVGMILEA